MIVNITLPNTSYDITIDTLQTLAINKKVVVVTNPTISKLHLVFSCSSKLESRATRSENFIGYLECSLS